MPGIKKPGAQTRAQRARAVREEQKERMRERTKDIEEHSNNNVRPIGKPKTDEDIAQYDEIQFCMKMAAQGFTPAQIAHESVEVLGYEMSEDSVAKRVRRELNKMREPLASEIRKLEDLNIQFLRRQLAPAIENHDREAISEARKLSDTRRRMWGADMPANVRVSGEVLHTLDPAVAALFEETKQDQARQEAQVRQLALEDPNIIEAEIVDPDYRDEPYTETPEALDFAAVDEFAGVEEI